jgi:hypothetical protein
MKGHRYCLTSILHLSPFSSRTTFELAMFVFMHDTADCLLLTRRGFRHLGSPVFQPLTRLSRFRFLKQLMCQRVPGARLLCSQGQGGSIE